MGSEPDLDALFGPGEAAEAPQLEKQGLTVRYQHSNLSWSGRE